MSFNETNTKSDVQFQAVYECQKSFHISFI